jgi:hypothetical protein
MKAGLIDRAADSLRASSRAFTSKNLHHEALRLKPEGNAPWTFEVFRDGPLARRLLTGPIAGLLPPPCQTPDRRRLPREWFAYFPAAILLVDRREIVDLFAASGILVQGRIAVVCVDGSPEPIVHWLRAGFRRGYRAPVGYLHDANTVLYPFLCEPLATLVASSDEQLPYRDLGIGPVTLLRDPLGIASSYERTASELEELPPCSLVAYAARRLLRMIAPDSLLAPRASSQQAHPSGTSGSRSSIPSSARSS